MARALPAAAVLLLLVAAAAAPRLALGCTTIIVGSRATADGSILISRSDDGDDYFTANNLVYHPARDEPALLKSNLNKFEIVLPAPGLAYFGLPNIPADAAQGRNATGEASGVNSAGVAVSATESIYNSAEALAADPYNTESGVIEEVVPSLLLPQARSAREGMALLGALVEERGAGEGYGVLVADAKEAWYIETAGGHHWLAQRVPDDEYFVSGNQGRFQEVNLEDTENVMASQGLLEFAVSSGLYDPSSGRPFSFFQAFIDKNPGQRTYSHPRVRKLQELYSGARAALAAAGAAAEDQLRPVFLPPSRPLRWQDVAAGMRYHFEGSRHDAYTHMNPEEQFRPVTLLRTGNGHITQLRPAGSVPDGLSVINHVAWGMTVLSPFIPLYKGLPHKHIPKELALAGPHPDRASLFWKARRLQALVFQDWPSLAPAAAAAIQAFEDDVDSRQRPALERKYTATLAAGGPGAEAAAAAELAGFTISVVRQACDLLEALAQQAAAELGMRQVPSDGEITKMLDAALAAYAFEPPYASMFPKSVAGLLGEGRGLGLDLLVPGAAEEQRQRQRPIQQGVAASA